jgi:Zn-finger nucleic acid-binding protein
LEKAVAASPQEPANLSQNRRRNDIDHSDYRPAKPYYTDRRKSWLNEIFD